MALLFTQKVKGVNSTSWANRAQLEFNYVGWNEHASKLRPCNAKKSGILLCHWMWIHYCTCLIMIVRIMMKWDYYGL